MVVYETDIAIIGSGMGGGMLARALAQSGRQVSIFERGERLVREPENWSVASVFRDKKYKNAETWFDRNKKPFLPGVHYFVGGNTKVYGASLPRFRAEDFEEYSTKSGISPAWPFSYEDLEPYYLEAEHALGVHGSPGADTTEPPRSGPYAYPALSHEEPVKELADRLRRQGLNPYPMPMGVDVRDGGKCILCKTCDGFPCKVGAKSDAETCGVDEALRHGAELHTGVRVTRLVTDSNVGKNVITAEGYGHQGPIEIRAQKFVVSAGAANSALLLLNSANDHHPQGLANSSGLVGRNWMVHNATFMIASRSGRRNAVSFQKTMGFNDWYLDGPDHARLGNVQMLGKIQSEMVTSIYPWVPELFARYITDRSVDLYLESEDLPDPENRVYWSANGRICVSWKPNNLSAHRELVSRSRRALIKAGFPLVLTKRMGIETNSHMCGTVVAGHDPKFSVLNEFCRAHDVENLFVVDGSFFPSSAAMNPALTIAAQAFRVAAEGEL